MDDMVQDLYWVLIETLARAARIEYRRYVAEKRSKPALQFLEERLSSDISTNVDAFIERPNRIFESQPWHGVLEKTIHELRCILQIWEQGYGEEPVDIDNKRRCLQNLEGFYKKWLHCNNTIVTTYSPTFFYYEGNK
eukprot:gene938-804_t